MTKGITRRRFIKGSAAVGAAASFGGGIFAGSASGVETEETPAGLAVATGPDGWANTMAAVEADGGIAGIVPSGSKVAINANTAFKHRGSIVAPGVLLAVLELCAEAGASEVWLLKEAKDGFWERCDRAEKKRTVIDAARVSERDYEVVKIDRGLALKEAHVDRHWLTADVVLNVTLAKHHKGCGYTGALKNTMGACPHDPTCRFFHVGSKPDSEDWYPDMAHMSQCIADLNTIRKPDLTILDAGEILLTNGPFGPGKLSRPGAVAAGVDMVALDAYGVRYLDLEPDAVPMIARAAALGIGNPDLSTVGIREIALG